MTRPAFGDQKLRNTVALPNGAATVYGAGIKVGFTERGDFTLNVEVKITVPALAVGVLANAATMKWSVVTEDAEPGSPYDPDVLIPDVITQTGAGGVGAAGTTWQGRLPIGGVLKSIYLKGVKSGSGDASAQAATLEILA